MAFFRRRHWSRFAAIIFLWCIVVIGLVKLIIWLHWPPGATGRDGVATASSVNSEFEIKRPKIVDEDVDATAGKEENLASSVPSTDSSEVKIISLVGERNSGTTWMLKELRRCYNDTFTVLNHFIRHKHYFQFDDGESHENTLIVSEFRDPYQWVLAMVEKPRRTTSHRMMDWKTFVNTPWTTERAASDRKYANSTGRVCQQHFRYNEVISCESHPPADEYIVNKSDRIRNVQSVPIYEMNPRTLEPYKNVVEMRADKIRNHAVEIKDFDYVEDVVVVLYEDLLKKGTKQMLDEITQITGKQPHCEATPPQPERPLRPMPPGFKEWMDENVDWDAEAIIGYSKY